MSFDRSRCVDVEDEVLCSRSGDDLVEVGATLRSFTSLGRQNAAGSPRGTPRVPPGDPPGTPPKRVQNGQKRSKPGF